MISQNLTENNFKQKIKLWFLENPEFNPYTFSFGKLYRKLTSKFRTLPYFIIIGVGRAGTTALYSYLIQHPSIHPALNDDNKLASDIHFFEYMISDDIQWYRSHFPILSSKQITGEFTSTYIYHPDVPKRIFNLLPQIKLIVILRNPIDKAYSTYYQQFRYGECSTTFEETIEAEFQRMNLLKKFPEINSSNPDFSNSVAHNIIRHGIYADYLENWLNIFNKDQLLILNADDLKQYTEKTLEHVFNFLNVSNHNIKNTSKISARKYPSMDNSTRKKLIDFYKPHNQRLNKLLGTSFQWDI